VSLADQTKQQRFTKIHQPEAKTKKWRKGYRIEEGEEEEEEEEGRSQFFAEQQAAFVRSEIRQSPLQIS
jgi:hypothetical protein